MIKMTAKTVFLSITLLIFPAVVSGYGSAGHARQQLRLIAIQLIEPRLNPVAMRLNLPNLPVSLMEGADDRLIDQLDVLVEEGLVWREPMIATERILSSQGLTTRQAAGYRYDRPLMLRNAPLPFGRAKLERTGEIWLLPQEDEATRAEVHFLWSAEQLAEWLWAPAFDRESRVERLKSSTRQPLSGVATLVWDGQNWQLAELMPYAQ